MAKRTNTEWLAALQSSGEAQAEALSELREYLVRAVFVYLRDGRSELEGVSTDRLYEMAQDYAQEAQETVENFLDACLSVNNLIDIHASGIQRQNGTDTETDSVDKVVRKIQAKDC